MPFQRSLIPLGQRGSLILLEHAAVRRENDTAVFEQESNGVYKTFNIPHVNCSLVLLGEGTSITRDAAQILADSGTLVAFCGGGGTPLLSGIPVDFLPLNPESEYRPTEYMQIWAKRFFDEQERLRAAKDLLKERYRKTRELWNTGLCDNLDSSALLRPAFLTEVENAKDTNQLLAVEGNHAKSVYKTIARATGVDTFTRTPGTGGESVNRLLDHANYLAYGCGAVALHALGISFAFAALHGKTRRGGLVFDIADLIKDGITVPLAFAIAAQKKTDAELRRAVIDLIHEQEILSYLIDTTKTLLCGK